VPSRTTARPPDGRRRRAVTWEGVDEDERERLNERFGTGLTGKLARHMEESNLADDLENWLKDNAVRVNSDCHGASGARRRAASGADFSLDSQELHAQFLKVIEDQLTSVMEEEDLTIDEFQDQCRREIEDRGESGAFCRLSCGSANFMNAMIKSWEFENFVHLCRDYAEEQATEDDRERAPPPPTDFASPGNWESDTRQSWGTNLHDTDSDEEFAPGPPRRMQRSISVGDDAPVQRTRKRSEYKDERKGESSGDDDG
jgi:hypothetical protein